MNHIHTHTCINSFSVMVKKACRLSGGDERERKMGRRGCCEKGGLKRGKWSAEEDEKLVRYINANGEGSWRSLPTNAGLLRCGKSCRLRWMNYLRSDVKRGNFTEQEEGTIVKLHNTFGNRWSLIAFHLPGRTDNEIKNYWNSHLTRKIYKFRFLGDSPLSEADMIKMVTKAKQKKLVQASKNAAAASKPGVHGHGPSSAEQAFVNAVVVPDESSALSTEGRPDDDAKAMDMLEPLSEVDDEMLRHLKNFLEDEPEVQCQDVLMMNADNRISCEERGGWSSDIDAVNLYACSSPVVSYFTDDVQQWDHNGAGDELNLWSEEEEVTLIWSWDRH